MGLQYCKTCAAKLYETVEVKRYVPLPIRTGPQGDHFMHLHKMVFHHLADLELEGRKASNRKRRYG
jgi:hypothetical protein